MKNLGRISQNSCLYFHCDVQTRFIPLIHGMENVIDISQKLLQTCDILQIPVILTQQNTKVFGETPEDILKFKPKQKFHSFEKSQFSMVNEDVKKVIQEYKPKSVILSGIEAHVCVQQTCLDLLDMNIDVHLIAEGTSSQKAIDRKYAIQRMQQSGAFLSTFESTVFEILKDQNHPQFKQILPILKQQRNGFFNQKL